MTNLKEQIVWLNHTINVLKLDVDGSARGKQGHAGCGGVLRDESGDNGGVFYGPIGIHDSNVAKILAIKITFNLLTIPVAAEESTYCRIQCKSCKESKEE
ncbi:hypothetical protein REPUB_Repub13aG0003100 [Reevesia pubescens]